MVWAFASLQRSAVPLFIAAAAAVLQLELRAEEPPCRRVTSRVGRAEGGVGRVEVGSSGEVGSELMAVVDIWLAILVGFLL